MRSTGRFLALTTSLAGSLAAAGSAPGAGNGPSARPTNPMPRLVFASYNLGYQGDARKAVPARLVRLASGATALTNHPWEGVGPWLSHERAQWHRHQLQVMAGAGIDVALVRIRAGARERQAGGSRGLGMLGQALKELRTAATARAGRPYETPQLGPAIELASLADTAGGRVDLKKPRAQEALYRAIRDFCLRVPETSRAAVAVADGPAVIVRLVGGPAVTAVDRSFATYCEQRFAAEFGGSLLWIGTPDLREMLPGLAAYAAENSAAGPARLEPGGLVTAASLGPGFENALGAGDGSARTRASGAAYILDWRAAMEARPDWVFLDSWNDYTRGTELAPTMEYGLQYRDLTRGATMQFKESPAAHQYAGTIVRSALPRALQPGAIYAVEVLVKNDGRADWDPFAQLSLSYRWLQDGRPVGDPVPAVALAQPRGEQRAYTLPVTAPLRGGKPLPEGTYEIEIGLLRRAGPAETWLPAEAALPQRVSVHVGDVPPLRPRWLGSDMPATARAGLTYRVTVHLRNDGSEAWLPEKGSAVAWRWRSPGDPRAPALREGPKTPLPGTVAPGRALAITVPVELKDAQGKPLSVRVPGAEACSVLEWDLWNGSDWASGSGSVPLREAVEPVERDPAPGFIGCNLPGELVAGRVEKVTVGLRNLGPEPWRASRDRIAVHWYYLDGSEAAWMDSSLPLPEDVPPYSEVQVPLPAAPPAPAAKRPRKTTEEPEETEDRTAPVRRDLIARDVPVQVPHYFGPMYCVFDLIHDGQPASTAPGNKGTDILVVPVNVYSPSYTPLPLSPFFDTDGISSDLNRTDGNLDDRGNTLPAESLPPYVSRPAIGTGPSASPIYPCGLWVRAVSDLKADRVTFLYPGKADRTMNMIACDGQRIPLANAARTAVHLLAVGTGERNHGEFRLIYADASTDVRPFTVSHFSEPPAQGGHAAFITAQRHTPAGDDFLTRCHLSHYVLSANSQKPLTALELPRSKGIKILAITLETGSLGGR